MPKEKSAVKDRNKVYDTEPPQYDVFCHNDDFTPMDFVVMVLVEVFFMPVEQAVETMLAIHNSDKVKVGTYSYDIAHSKKDRATSIARQNGFPLQLTVTRAS